MSSKTSSSHREPPATGKSGKKKTGAKPVMPSAVTKLDSEFNMRFHKYFSNVMIPVIGILSLLTLIPQLSSSAPQDAYYWVRLVYNSLCIALCLVAFPGMRNNTEKGWKATIALLAVNALYSLAMVLFFIVFEPDTVQALVSAASVLLFTLIIPYYKRRRKLFHA